MASNEGDFILDPFVGGGTTASVAERLGRRWIGIDQSVQDVKVSDMRLKTEASMYATDIYSTEGLEVNGGIYIAE